jgi:hypothetical protein
MYRSAILCLMLLSTAASAATLKEKDVPFRVSNAFKKTYHKVSGVTWSFAEGRYQADFKADGKNKSAVIARDGTIIDRSTEIRTSAVPAPVKKALTERYPGKKVLKAFEVVHEGSVNYRLDLSGNERVILDAEGKKVR